MILLAKFLLSSEAGWWSMVQTSLKCHTSSSISNIVKHHGKKLEAVFLSRSHFTAYSLCGVQITLKQYFGKKKKKKSINTITYFCKPKPGHKVVVGTFIPNLPAEDKE